MNDDPAAMEEAMAAAAVLGAALARFQNALDRLRKPPEALSEYRKQQDPGVLGEPPHIKGEQQ